jgi:hypothetical protein
MGFLAPGSAHVRPSAPPILSTFWICFLPKSFFCEFKPHAKFRNPMITPSGRKVCAGERREKNNAVNSGHLVPWQLTQPLGPTYRPTQYNLLFWHPCLSQCGLKSQRRVGVRWLAKTFVHLKKVFFSLLFKREKILCTLKMIFQHFSVNIDQVTLKEYSRIQIGRWPQFFGKWETTSIFGKMEDDLHFWQNGRLPQYLGKWKMKLEWRPQF